MTGIGGDELFGGYSTFRYEWASQRGVGLLGRAIGRLSGPLGRGLASWSEQRGETKWPLLLLAQGADRLGDPLSRWLQVRRLTPPDTVAALVHSARPLESRDLRSMVRSLLSITASL